MVASRAPWPRLNSTSARRFGGAFFQTRVCSPRIGIVSISNRWPGAHSNACAWARDRLGHAVASASTMHRSPARAVPETRAFLRDIVDLAHAQGDKPGLISRSLKRMQIADPATLGMDAGRLRRIDRFLDERYIQSG